MEDSGGARNARSFYTQRLRRPRGIVRARGGAHLHLRSRCACSLSSSLFFFLSSNVSRWLREQSVTLWTRGLKWRAGNVRKLAERTNERTKERTGRAFVSLWFSAGKTKIEKEKSSSLLVDVAQTMAAKCPSRIFPACTVVFRGKRTTNVASRVSKALLFRQSGWLPVLGERFRWPRSTRVSPRKHRISRSRVSLIG